MVGMLKLDAKVYSKRSKIKEVGFEIRLKFAKYRAQKLSSIGCMRIDELNWTF